jgi:site-specific recombinase XerD
MTHLRKMMLEELQRRNYSENTIRCYIRTVEDFARRFKCPPDRLGPQHIRQYQAELFQKRKLSSGTVVIHLAALRFFYTKTLRRHWSIADTPYPKKTHRLPTILSQEEVAQLIDAASTLFHRTLLMTLYATGARLRHPSRWRWKRRDHYSRAPREAAPQRETKCADLGY